jgi:hypothetical protein
MKWRDVNEKVPSHDGTVLAWDEVHGHQLASYSKVGKLWIPENRKIRKLDVTHWQPLPPAPVDESEVVPS